MSGREISFEMDRRTAIKWVMAAATVTAWGRGSPTPGAAASAGSGYGTDPDLLKVYKPGELWPLTFNQEQSRTAAALCALIIPADEHSPSAAEIKVHVFIDEWISAPYAQHGKDREQVIAGFAWLDAESMRRFERKFTQLDTAQQSAICDDICWAARAKAGLAVPAAFFARFRDLTAAGFYTSPQGTADLQYVGNTPLQTFDGPSPAILKKVGLL